MFVFPICVEFGLAIFGCYPILSHLHQLPASTGTISIQPIWGKSVQAVKFVKVIWNVRGSSLGWDTDEPERVSVVSFSPKTQIPKQ